MSKKISITLDSQVLQFVDQQTDNRSRFINEILLKMQRELARQKLLKAYEEQAQDLEFQQELADWDIVAGDGLNA